MKIVYDKLMIKFNAIDTELTSTSSVLVTKTQYDLDNHSPENNIEDVDKKIPNSSGLVKKTDCNTKIPDIENKIPSITRAKKTNNLVIGNADDEKNLYPDSRKFIFLINLIKYFK